MDKDDKRNLRREQVERCLSSSLSIREWCKRNGVPASTMYHWMRMFRDEEPGLFGRQSTGDWIEVTKESLSRKTALAPVTAPPAKALRPPDHAAFADTATDGATSIIHARINGIDLAIPAGAAESDVGIVFRAAARL